MIEPTVEATDRRAQIVAALATVPGLSPSRAVPDVIVRGSAWPAWAATRWVNLVPGGIRAVQWRVFVALAPTTAEVTADEADSFIEPVGMALASVGGGLGVLVEPVQAPVIEGGPTVPLLRFTLTD